MCFRQCTACNSVYKNEIHDCVKNLIEQLQSLKTENEMYEQDEEALKKELERGQKVDVHSFAKNLEEFYDNFWVRLTKE